MKRLVQIVSPLCSKVSKFAVMCMAFVASMLMAGAVFAQEESIFYKDSESGKWMTNPQPIADSYMTNYSTIVNVGIYIAIALAALGILWFFFFRGTKKAHV